MVRSIRIDKEILMEVVIGVAIAIVIFVSVLLVWSKVINPIRELKYNIRQLSIYDRTTQLIFQAAQEQDIPMPEIVAALNAAVDTYNESLRGKDIEGFAADYFPQVSNTNEIGRQDNLEGKEPQGKE